jgi:CDP-glycerol glycerophosphotransferase (TagB/SpsB family)
VQENRKPVVYLQHGIVAMKRIFYNNNSYGGRLEKFIVSSEREKQLLVRGNRFNESRLAVTGLPRYDWLWDQRGDTPVVLLMPTWREWISERFEESEFFRQYSLLLESRRLQDVLEYHEATLVFAPHSEVREKFAALSGRVGSRVNVAAKEGSSIQEYIRRSHALVTDYSSVAWDFVYLGKPVVFFHFDREEYLSRRGAYIDLETEVPGPVALDASAVTEHLNEVLSGRGKGETKPATSRFFDFTDRGNCARVYGAVRRDG